jgi:hypothetical protein
MEFLTNFLHFARTHNRSPSAATIHSKTTVLERERERERERDYLVAVVVAKQQDTRAATWLQQHHQHPTSAGDFEPDTRGFGWHERNRNNGYLQRTSKQALAKNENRND